MSRDRAGRLQSVEPAAGGPKLFPVADLAQWSLSTAEPKRFIMSGFLPEREMTLATGAGGANKSTFGQQLATCCAAGVPMLGIEVEPVPALYLTCEDDPERLHWMAEHICRALGVNMADLAGRLHLSSLRGQLGNELANFDTEGKLRPSPSFASLRATIIATGARLVVLDNAAHFFAGNENDRGQVTAFVNLLYSLCRELDVTILLIAHSNKAGDTYSGSTAWLNAVRSQIVLQRPEDSLDPDERLLTLGKANYARQGAEVRFRWHDFALVRDDDLPADKRLQLAAVTRASAENDAFMHCLAAATDAKRAVSHNPGTNYFGTVFPAMPQSNGLNTSAFKSAFERLLHLRQIELDAPLWKRENRSWKYGIRAAKKRTDPPAPTPCTDPHRPPAQTIEIACTDPHAPTPLYPTDIWGAASEAAAPLQFHPDHPDAPDTNPGWSG